MAATLEVCDTAVLIAGFKNVLKYMPQKLKRTNFGGKKFFFLAGGNSVASSN